MPSSLTHGYFAMDVYDKLDGKAKDKINNLDYLNILSC